VRTGAPQHRTISAEERGSCVQELEMILSAYNNWGIHDGTPDLISDQMGRTHS
jgi:hypothetical protein